MDSGSTYTIMDQGLYLTLPESKRPSLRKIQLTLRSATGEVFEVHGEAKMNIALGNKSFQYPVKVSLRDKSSILGLDFMKDEDCLKRGLLQIGSDSHSLKLHRQDANKCTRIQVAESIPPQPRNDYIWRNQPQIQDLRWVNGGNRTNKVVT